MRTTLVDHIERTTWHLIYDYGLTSEEVKELVNRFEFAEWEKNYVKN